MIMLLYCKIFGMTKVKFKVLLPLSLNKCPIEREILFAKFLISSNVDSFLACISHG